VPNAPLEPAIFSAVGAATAGVKER
jgi:hypothetical protein